MHIITVPVDVWDGQKYPTKFNDRSLPVRYIVLHTTGGTNSLGWLSKWNRENPLSTQNDVSIHYLISRDGTIYDIVPDDKRAWHVGASKMPDGETDGNSCSIGIEIEHLNEPDYPEPQLQATAELVSELMHKYDIDSKHVVSHASVALPLGRKIDPVNFDWAGFWNRIFTTPTYSDQSPLIASPIVDEARLGFFVAKHANKNYTAVDLRLITSYYAIYGQASGVDWVFALAQSIHETGWFSSWWSARPRRNPAGIMVTGQTSKTQPKDPNWAYNPKTKLWHRGQSFKSWDISVQHHLSRLLCYALTDDQMTPEQLIFSNICNAKARLKNIRGYAQKAIGLNGTWAYPGTLYAQAIAATANSLIAGAR